MAYPMAMSRGRGMRRDLGPLRATEPSARGEAGWWKRMESVDTIGMSGEVVETETPYEQRPKRFM